MYEVVIFKKEYLKNMETILSGDPIIIKGNLSFKNGDISIIAEKNNKSYKFKKN